MGFLLRYVSGGNMLEKSLKNSKQGFAKYACSTDDFFPCFPRNQD